jgi:hypothetical protein
MEIKFQGQYEKGVFFKAVRLANQPVGNQRRFLWLMFMFALGALILLIFRVFETGDLVGNAILLGAAVIMVIVVSGIFLRPLIAAQKMWANPGTRRILKGQVTNRGIVYLLNEGRNEIPWERIIRVRKVEDVVALVRNDGLLLVFPEKFFKRKSDWRKFVRMVEKRMGGVA